MDTIQNLRSQIDIINLDLCRLLIERKKIVEKIGNQKRVLGINVYDRTREALIYEMLKKNYTVDEVKFLEPIFKEIMKMSRDVQLEHK